MGRILTPSFWLTLFLNTLLTMLMIYLIKKMFKNTNIPVVSTIVEET